MHVEFSLICRAQTTVIMTKYRPSNLRGRSSEDQRCKFCSRKSKYRCPKTLLVYCGLSCYKKIQQDLKDGKVKAAEPPKTDKAPSRPAVRGDFEDGAVPVDSWAKYDDENDRLPEETLARLATSKELKDLLANPHLRQMLSHINTTRNKDRCMEKAMQEPIFVEFADACLKMVDPEGSDTEVTSEPQVEEDEAARVKEFELAQF